MDTDIRAKTAAVRRDAFIVSQIVAAAGELDDFQRNAAMEKARDHIEAAMKRARENPAAARQTFELVDQRLQCSLFRCGLSLGIGCRSPGGKDRRSARSATSSSARAA